MAHVMVTADLKTLCTGTYKVHPPLIVIGELNQQGDVVEANINLKIVNGISEIQ